jgi:hypothetical protein
MSWVLLMLGFLKDLLFEVITSSINTPAETTNVEKTKGAAANPGDDFFASRNRVSGRSEAK